MKTAQRDRLILSEHFTQTRPLRIQVITLSDRATAGEYEDRSGPKLAGHLNEFFDDSGVAIQLERSLLSDDAEGLRKALVAARDSGVHAVFTTGGTGIGPRDNTPEVILALADKVIPGIMEHIRVKYSENKPCALLSRTVAATMGSTVIYALPGSSKRMRSPTRSTTFASMNAPAIEIL